MKFLFSALALALSLSVSVSAAEAPAIAPTLWNNSAEASLLQASGNTDVFTAGLGLESIYNPDPWRYLAKGGFLLNKNSGVTTAEKYTAELRGERKIIDSLSGFVDGNFLRDMFGGFKSRYGIEAGAKYGIFNGPVHTLAAEVGVGGLFEDRVDNTTRNFVSLSPGLEYRWKFSPTAEFSNLVKAVLDVNTFADWRLNDTLALTTALTSILSARVSFAVDYVNQPVAGKKTTDTATSFALVAKF